MFRRLAAASLGFLGLLGAHEITYSLVGGAGKDALLHSTGHGWQEQLPLLIVAAVFALIVGSIGGVRRNHRVGLASVLAFQVTGYVAIELLERALNGHHVLPSMALVLVGAALQFPVALVVWMIHRAVVDAIETFLVRHGVKLSEPSAAAFPFSEFVFISRVLTGMGARSPPLHLHL
jgi:hypothetical protein